MAETRLCPTCGDPFQVSGTSHQRYCSEPCRPKHGRPRKKRPPADVECGFCGKSFERTAWIAEKAVRLGQKQYCSTKCRDDAKRGRKGEQRVERIRLECPSCGKSFVALPAQVRSGRRFCSLRCAGKAGGRKGGIPGKGRWITKDGYVMVYVPPDQRFPGREGEVHEREHRVVMAKKLGRWPESHETVHHINGDKTDNRPENLQLRNGRHGKGGVLRCRACGSHDIEHIDL